MLPNMQNNSFENHSQSSFGGYPHNGGGNANPRGGTGAPPTTINPVGLGGIRPPTSNMSQPLAPDFAGGGIGMGNNLAKPVGVGGGNAPVNFRSAPQPQMQPPTSLAHTPVNRTAGFSDGQGLGGMRPLMSY